jgi:outer membrane protein assembly factor BamA
VDSFAGVPDDDSLARAGARIGIVTIQASDVFDVEDPAEDRWLFRAANAVHRRTREGVVRRLLLFRPGDPYSRRVLEESERLLRSTGYFYDAEIRPVRFQNGFVDVEVRTRDVWTLRAGVGYGRAGGVNRTKVGVEDANFLGTGSSLVVRQSRTVDRTSLLYRFRQPNLLGRRVAVEFAYSDNSDGRLVSGSVERPFFSFATRWAAGFGATREERVDTLYRLGQPVERFLHRREAAEFRFGRSAGIEGRRARRFLVGFSYGVDRFAPAPGQAQPALLPDDRRLAYPWIEFQTVEDAYVEVRDLDRIARTEDVHLGFDGRVRVGLSAPAFGGDRTRAVFEGELRRGSSPGPGQLLSIGARGSARLSRGRIENGLLGGTVRYYRRSFGRHVLFASVSTDFARDLDRDRQLLLGGDSGLRGYPLRFQEGDRRYLLTVEQRFYTDWHVFRLFHVGGAVFLDVGRAWFHGDPAADLGEPLKDVGVGLRIGSSRSSAAAIVHVDVAVPLDRDGPARGVQFLVTTRETF